MKKLRLGLLAACLLLLTGATQEGCNSSSDDIQRQQQEMILKEGTAQVGMPAIKNFRERRLLKDIIEMRDQNGLVTYTYLENLIPTVVRGKTALGGKLTFLGQTVGYGLPYATQFTNPQKYVGQSLAMPQADPNGLFSPASAEGTWIMMKDPEGKDARPVYVEPRVAIFPFKLPDD